MSRSLVYVWASVILLLIQIAKHVYRKGAKSCIDPHMDVGIEKIHALPDFRTNSKNEGPLQYNDIALIHRSIHFTDFIQPIALTVRLYQCSKIFNDVARQDAG